MDNKINDIMLNKTANNVKSTSEEQGTRDGRRKKVKKKVSKNFKPKTVFKLLKSVFHSQ